MKVRMLKDWGYYKQGQVVDVFEPVAFGWVQAGAAERFTPSEEKVERAAVSDAPRVERATKKYSQKR